MLKDNTIGKIIGRRAAKELRVDDIVNIGIGIPEMVSRYARKSGMLDMVTLTVESGGIGGFANITAKTPTVVFCMSFNAKGLTVSQKSGEITIEKEGSVPKFVEHVNSISFSSKRAIENGQKVLYVTERCVFRLTPKGLKLIEVYPGIDAKRDILDQLPFEVEYKQ